MWAIFLAKRKESKMKETLKDNQCLFYLFAVAVLLTMTLATFASNEAAKKERIYDPEDLYALDLASELQRLVKLLDKKPPGPVAYSLLVKKAQIEFARGSLQDAKKGLEKALKLDPKGKSARYFFAKALLFMGDYEKADRALDDLVESYPRFANVYADLTFLEMGTDSKHALRLIDKAISLNDSEPYFYFLRASILAQEKQYSKALENFSKAIEMGYGFGGAHSALPYALRANLYLALNRHREALRDSLCALALSKGKKIVDYSLLPPKIVSSGSGSYEFSLWSIYYSENKMRHCEQIVNSLPAKEVEKGVMAIAKAMQLLSKQQNQEALALLNANEERLAKEFPEGLYWAMGNVYCAQNKYDFALGKYDRLYARKQYNIGLTICKARILACGPDNKYHDPGLAVKMLETCCAWTENKSPRLVLELAIAYGADAKFEKANEAAKKALELLPHDSNLRGEFGEVAQKLQNKKAILFEEGFWQMPYFPF
jgi:tetratricopeptide (TPR) repeat protein